MGCHGPSTTQVAFLARSQLPWEVGSVRESRVLSTAQLCPWLCSQQTKGLGSWLASGRGVACCVAEPVSLLPQREEEPPGAKAAPTEWIIACMEGCGDSRLSPPLGMGHRSWRTLSPEETGVDPMAVLRMFTTAMLLPPPSVLWGSVTLRTQRQELGPQGCSVDRSRAVTQLGSGGGLAVNNSCWAELAEARTKMNTGQGPRVTLGRCSGFRTGQDVKAGDRSTILGPASCLRPLACTGVAGNSGVLRQAIPREVVKLGLP